MSIRRAQILPCLLIMLVGCSKTVPPTGKTSASGPGSNSAATATMADDPNADVGTALYTPAAPPVIPPQPLAGLDPIAIPCIVQYEDKQQLSTEVDGMIELVATPMIPRNGRFEFTLIDPTSGAEKVVVYDPARPHPSIVFHPRDKNKEYPYWKLVDGDRVSQGQVLCVLDDELWLAKKKAAEEIKRASITSRDSAKEGVSLSREKVLLDKKGGNTVSYSDLLNDQITMERFVENLAQAEQSIAKAESDLQEAIVNLRKHQITSRVDGIIRSVTKRPGETARAGEKIMEIQSTEKVRLEGVLDVQYYDRVKRHMDVGIEPALPSAPVKSHAWHRSEVGGIAVTGHAQRPLVVSASLDGSALLWDPNLKNETGALALAHSLPHPVGVRSVACTPPGVSPILVVTGAEDGKLRIWDVTDVSHLPRSATREPEDTHTSGIHAIAVSPNGKYAATAAGRDVFIWDLDAGKKLYTLPQEHRDTVTTVTFTPQDQLVTGAKDNSIKVWKLGATKAAVTKTIEHRSGALEHLSVCPGGGRILFDQDKGRIDLVGLADAQTTGQLTNGGPNISFANMAIFAPDHGDSSSPFTIATGGGEGDLKGGLQVWQMPRSGGRGSEIARLMTPGRVPVVCATFSPHKEQRFLVVGTDKGSVHLWVPPASVQKRLEGRVTNVESSDPRFVTVRVEMTNKGLGLLDRSAATVIVDPTR